MYDSVPLANPSVSPLINLLTCLSVCQELDLSESVYVCLSHKQSRRTNQQTDQPTGRDDRDFLLERERRRDAAKFKLSYKEIDDGCRK